MNAPSAAPLLEVDQIEVVYGGAILAVADVSLTVGPGEIVALLGANGAGKSTTLKAISGLAAADRAQVRKGAIRFDGASILALPAHRVARRGIVHVLEGRRVFAHLTVEENLVSGALVRRPGAAELRRAVEEVYQWFPRLRDKRRTLAGLTSGGEQQMLAIGRAILTKPRLVLLDEPSMGLAPLIVQDIFRIIRQLNRDTGTAFVLAEQNISLSLAHANRAYVIDAGKIALSGPCDRLAERTDIHQIYLGSGASNQGAVVASG
jgi:branched-chain amino acid transport system ATP-binding protein